MGSTGATGATGSDGDKGQKGDLGATGATGATGSTGANGSDGDKGQKGDLGVTGSTGATGATGSTGSNGSDGDKGQKGELGSTGATGSNGSNGSDGSDGDKGQKGELGSTGATGSTGSNGSDGDKGQKGELGVTGSNGSDGSDGDKGQKGELGVTGATGSNGSDGDKGQKGDLGATGTTGATGDKGEQGDITEPVTLTSSELEFQDGSSNTLITIADNGNRGSLEINHFSDLSNGLRFYRDTDGDGNIKITESGQNLFIRTATSGKYMKFLDTGELTVNSSTATVDATTYDMVVIDDFYATTVTATSVSSFTGMHKCIIEKSYLEVNASTGYIMLVDGMLLSLTGQVVKESVVQVIPYVRGACIENLKTIYGALYQGKLVEYDADNYLVYAIGLGEGQMWVTNMNGNVNLGDMIISSQIMGYGRRQDMDNDPYSTEPVVDSTVAKCIETVNWQDITDTITYGGRTYKKVLISVTFHCS